MIQLIVGDKGKGKTKLLLESANEAIKSANGNIVYVDKSSKHMFELSSKIRLIDASVLPIKNSDQFAGAVCGIVSQDHDLEQVYMDSFLKLAKIDEFADNRIELIEAVIDEFQTLSDTFNVDFYIGMSIEKDALSEKLQALVAKAL